MEKNPHEKKKSLEVTVNTKATNLNTSTVISPKNLKKRFVMCEQCSYSGVGSFTGGNHKLCLKLIHFTYF